MYKCIENYGTVEESPTSVPETPQPISGWQGMYDALKTDPTYYRLNNYLTPYTSFHWESGAPMLRTLNDESLLPMYNEKVDPNKIFNSDIAALRTLAADQAKMLRVFEKKAMESLTDKNKFGLTEEDIESMQAITAARNAIVAINEKQINVKKHIADLKIKQQAAGGSISGIDGGDSKSSGGFHGTEVLDSIYAVAAKPIASEAPADYMPANIDQASSLLDSIVGVNPEIEKEKNGIVTKVIVGETTNDIKLADFKDNEMVSEPIEPTFKIDVDLQSGNARDEFNRPYVIYRQGNEIM